MPAKIVVSEFVSLDGVMEGPGPVDSFEFAGWTIPFFNDEISSYKAKELFAAGSLLIGRNTYNLFASTWPKMTDKIMGTDEKNLPGGFAGRMNGIQKYVVSTSLKQNDLSWDHSKLIGPNVVEELSKLKADSSQDLLLVGSATLVKTLIQNDLVDELKLLVYPVILGSGKQLLANIKYSKFNLIQSQAFSNGVLLQHYQLQKTLNSLKMIFSAASFPS